jgi:WD40 repeat protein
MLSSRALAHLLLTPALLLLSAGLQGQPSPAPDVVTVLKGHGDTIESVAMSPDGTLIATACFDKTIRLFEAATGKEIRSYGGTQGHTGQVLSVAFNARGDQIASGSADNTARVWDLPVGMPVKTFATSSSTKRVAVAADGQTFAVAGADGTIKVFPLGEEKGAIDLKGHVGAVTQLAASGTTWISAGADNSIRLWSADGKEAARYSPAPAEITGLVAGQSVYTISSDNLLRTWQLPPQATRAFPVLKEAIAEFTASADGNTVLYGTASNLITAGTISNNQATGSFTAGKTATDLIRLSPDTTTILTGGKGGTVALWDRQGKSKGEITAHPGGVTAAVFHPAQPLLYTAGEDGLVKGWTLPFDPKLPAEKAVKLTLKAHTGKVTGLVSNQATGQLISSGADKLIRFWDVAKPDKPVREIGPLASIPSSLTLSRDGQMLISAAGKEVLAWNTADGKEIGKLSLPLEAVALSISTDKTRLLIGRADNLAVLVDLPAGTIYQTFPFDSAARGLLLHPSLPVVVAPTLDKTVAISPITCTKATPLGGKAARLVISPGLDRLVTAGPGNECVSWLTGTGQKEKAFPTGGEATAAAISKDGQRLAAAGADGSVKLYTTADAKLIGSFDAGRAVAELAFHPTLPQLVGTVKNQAIAWNVAFTAGQPLPPEFGRVIEKFSQPKGIASPVFNAQGSFLTAGEDNMVRRYRIASEAAVKTLQHPNLVDTVAFDDTGNLLATGCHDGILRIWDLPKNTPLKTINAHVVTMPQQVQNPIYCVLWSHDHKQVFTASFDKSIKLWDVASGMLVREFKAAPDPKPLEKKDEKKEEKKDDKPPAKVETGPFGHRDQVFTLALSKDGKYLASGSSDRSVKLWDVAAGKVVRDFANPDLKPVFPGEPAPSHPGWVQGVRFTPDGQYLVTVGAAPRNKSYIAVWNVNDGKRVYGAERDFGPIHALAISSDGTRLILGCAATRSHPEAEALVVKLPGK